MAALCLALTVGLLTGARPALASDAPTVTPAAGMVEVSFPLPAGAAVVFIPDDIAAGEAFSGTLEALTGFVLGLGTHRAQKGLFSWRVPSDTSDEVLLVLRDERGVEQGRVLLRTPAGKSATPSLRFPRLVQAGLPFPIHGPFDGDARTTHVSVGGSHGRSDERRITRGSVLAGLASCRIRPWAAARSTLSVHPDAERCPSG